MEIWHILLIGVIVAQYAVVIAMLSDDAISSKAEFWRLCVPFYWLYWFFRYKISHLIELYKDLF